MAFQLTPAALCAHAANPAQIRNVCILAHVDHGKTTLTDGLLAANGIVSAKQAGRVRFMDSTEEEQARGITMKSSAIALLHEDEPFRELKAKGGGSGGAPQPPRVTYLVNLIDSPGHVDFSMDVVTAARLCDGAVVVVDAVEGVCIQTHAVLRTAWQEGVRPILLINKLDRLICELKLRPAEAYEHLARIIESANVVVSSLFTAAAMLSERVGAAGGGVEVEAAAAAVAADQGEVLLEGGGTGVHTVSVDSWALDLDESAERGILFHPSRGNVLFASAFDGWAFSVDDFAKSASARLALPQPLLRRALWGNWFYKPKAKRIVGGAAAAAAAKGRNMAVSLMLERLWAVYALFQLGEVPEGGAGCAAVAAAAGGSSESPTLEAYKRSMLEDLGIVGRVSTRDLEQKDPRLRLQAVMRAWLPVASAVLSAVCRATPSPAEAQAQRCDKLWQLADAVAGAGAVSQATQQQQMPQQMPALHPGMTMEERAAYSRAGVAACSTDPNADVVVFVSKMFAVPGGSLPAPGAGHGTEGGAGGDSAAEGGALWGYSPAQAAAIWASQGPSTVGKGGGGGGRWGRFCCICACF